MDIPFWLTLATAAVGAGALAFGAVWLFERVRPPKERTHEDWQDSQW